MEQNYDNTGRSESEQSNSFVWDAWHRGRPRDLARYVAPKALYRLQLTPKVNDIRAQSEHSAEADFEIAKLLFETLKAKQLDAAIEPWDGDRLRQQIRHPSWLMDDRCGNCLDLSTTYAAMCLESKVMPLLVVDKGHATVAVVLGQLEYGAAHEPDLGFEWSDGLARVADAEAFRAKVDEGVVAVVDCLLATDQEIDFARATASGRAAISEGALLIDIVELHRMSETKPFPPPTTRPTVRLHSPGAQQRFDIYESHREIIEHLRNDSGIVVLAGPSGQGKSSIARKLVEDAPFGAGWFLNASEPQALTNSLADAELAERNESSIGLASADREGYAQAALARLQIANDPWIVVLDNADGDPALLLRKLPRTRDDQLVLITSTNREWEHVPGVRVRHLGPVDDLQVATTLGDDALVSLVGGRPLLLDGFARLIKNFGLSTQEIAKKFSGLDTASSALNGPAALWDSLRDHLDPDPSLLRLVTEIAYLPPDFQPLDLLTELHSDGRQFVERLAAGGLISWEDGSEFIRIHRLFSEAVRADMGPRHPMLIDEAVDAICRNTAARALLERHGDFATVRRLASQLEQIDKRTNEVDSDLGRSLHGMAGLLELHGHTRQSGLIFERAERHLQDQPSLLADCLHGRARTVNQHHAGDEEQLREALNWAESAEQLLIASGDAPSADRCYAMQGLIRQKLAAFPREGENKLELLHGALDVLTEAHRRRSERLHSDDSELARSYYNLAGIHIKMAQNELGDAVSHLDLAEDVYVEVARVRRRIYGRDEHPHVAACVSGLAIVNYYRAILVPASRSLRTQWLRAATDFATEALHQREAQEGSFDLDESTKVARLLAKIAMARHASSSDPEKQVSELATEVKDELTFSVVPPLSSGGRDIASGIEAWVGSPALARLVAKFDGDNSSWPADLGERLAWLDGFSERWDFRKGRERNLVSDPDFEPELRDLILHAAHALGLIGTTAPPSAEYDHVLILGGLVRACIARPMHAANLLNDGAIRAGSITALGGFRPLAGDEFKLAECLATPDLVDEFDAMDAGVKAAFEVELTSDRGEDFDEIGSSWRVREYATAGSTLVRVVAAPSSAPGERRANTADTYAWFANSLEQLAVGQRILLVTSDIYARFQHADAIRQLAIPHLVEVDVVGIQPGDVDPSLLQQFKPHNYLQEIRSTIRAMRALHEASQQTN